MARPLSSLRSEYMTQEDLQHNNSSFIDKYQQTPTKTRPTATDVFAHLLSAQTNNQQTITQPQIQTHLQPQQIQQQLQQQIQQQIQTQQNTANNIQKYATNNNIKSQAEYTKPHHQVSQLHDEIEKLQQRIMERLQTTRTLS